MKSKRAAFGVLSLMANSLFGRMNRTRIYPLIALALMIAIGPYVTAAPKFSDWAVPTNLGCQLNSSFGEQAPAISKDGLTTST